MSDNRMNRCEAKSSPLIFGSATSELGSSEYAQAFSPDKAPSAGGEPRPSSAIILRGADSEYAKAFGPKAPYSRPRKPEWMLNKYKSGFDLKSEPNAKFDGTTIYKEAFLDIVHVQEKSSAPTVVETLYTHGNDNGQYVCDSKLDSATSLELNANGQAGDSQSKKGPDLTVPESEDGNTTDDASLRVKPTLEEPNVKIVYSSLNGTNLESHWRKEQDQNLKIVSPRPLPPPPIPATPAVLPIRKTSLTTPVHGRKKVADEPSLYATPGLRYFMNSIRR